MPLPAFEDPAVKWVEGFQNWDRTPTQAFGKSQHQAGLFQESQSLRPCACVAQISAPSGSVVFMCVFSKDAEPSLHIHHVWGEFVLQVSYLLIDL